jgi:CRP-like cAMP-binding protein
MISNVNGECKDFIQFFSRKIFYIYNRQNRCPNKAIFTAKKILILFYIFFDRFVHDTINVTIVTVGRNSMELKQTQLLKGTNIDTKDIQIYQYPANHIIELEGSTSSYVGIILSGTILVQTYTVQGTSIMISTLEEGKEFGDGLMYGSKRHVYPGNVITKEPSTIARIPYDLIERYLDEDAVFRRNLLHVLSDKVIAGAMKSKLLAQETIRDKIFYFLAQEKIKQNSSTIYLGMTKKELARLLHVTRPSLSRELAHMKQEGLLDYNRKTITLFN